MLYLAMNFLADGLTESNKKIAFSQ